MGADERLPADARASLIVLAGQLQALQTMIAAIEKRISAVSSAAVRVFDIGVLLGFLAGAAGLNDLIQLVVI